MNAKFCKKCGSLLVDSAVVKEYDEETGKPIYVKVCKEGGCEHLGHYWTSVPECSSLKAFFWGNKEKCEICDKIRWVSYM